MSFLEKLLPSRPKTERAHAHEKPDMRLFAVIAFLSLWGAVMIYSGSAFVAARQGNEPYFFFLRQLIWISLGTIAGYIAYRIDYKILQKLALPGLLFVIGLLILVLAVNYDQPIKRWIDLGIFDLQPSELTKVAFLIYISSWLSNRVTVYKNSTAAFKEHLVNDLLPFLILLGVVSFLILVEPDLDTTIILGATSFIVYFIAGNDFIHLFGSASVAAVLGIVGFISTKFAQYRLDRVTNWIEFWKTGQVVNPMKQGFQLQQILVAVSTGGVFGVGFGESRQKFAYLGETAFTDTIFAIIAEELGLIGASVLIMLFAYILIRGYNIAKKAPDKFGFLLAISITTWLTLQAFLHIASNVALIPINGNTLPFISYGGSSTIVNLTAVGLLLNISKYNGKFGSKVSVKDAPKRRNVKAAPVVTKKYVKNSTPKLKKPTRSWRKKRLWF